MTRAAAVDLVPAVTGAPVSFWHATLGPSTLRQPLPGSLSADVCIVGAGFTGLWTAYYLKRAVPALRIVVLEREFSGFGASGRNGGFLMANLPGLTARYAHSAGRPATLAMQRRMVETVDEVIRVAEVEGIDADIVKSGYLNVATAPAQLERSRAMVPQIRSWGRHDVVLLSREQTLERVRIDGALGAILTPDCARIQPAKLARGLAEVVAASGVELYEQTPVVEIAPGRAITPLGTVEARHVVRATEAYSVSLSGLRRSILPLRSWMIVTEPVDDAFWAEVGWAGCETFSERAHAYMYLQRTADGRVAAGSAASPGAYRFGSRTRSDATGAHAAARILRRQLLRLFPALEHSRIEYAWSGVFGMPRDWCAGVGLDPVTGLAWAGGYAGHGVAATNLAGRTLRDLLLGEPTELTRLPWVGRPSRPWEPEPLRWLGVRTVERAYRIADRHERSNATRTSLLARLADRISGAAPL